MLKKIHNNWQQTTLNDFWGEVAPSHHVLQLYETEEIFLETLTGFVGDGINAGDACIIIATNKHLIDLYARLKAHGIYIESLVAENSCIFLDAKKTLAAFMKNGRPDKELFTSTATSIVNKARGERQRKVRAFGEMVHLLWKEGNAEATIELERLWNLFCKDRSLSLFCAYPSNSFPGNHTHAIDHICEEHSQLISGSAQQTNEVFYMDLPKNKVG